MHTPLSKVPPSSKFFFSSSPHLWLIVFASKYTTFNFLAYYQYPIS